MRAFAVIMMMQGHTIDSLLAENYRSFDSVLYTIWYTARGFTAPIFMFTSGVVFSYLLHSRGVSFKENPRVQKGLKRFMLLVFVGYLLRYPTWRIFNFEYVSEKQWKIFAGVDALHLIGFGLLFIILLYFISEKIKVKSVYLYLSGLLFFFISYPFVKEINWIEIFPLAIASYFYRDMGSLFPLFPWAGYVLGGAIFGYILSLKKYDFRSPKFASSLLGIGTTLIVVSNLIYPFGFDNGESTIWFSYHILFLRIGVVIFLNGLMAFLCLKLESLPSIIRHLGTHTLLIYAVHLVILYGSAWSPGISWKQGKSLSLNESLLAAGLMIFTMTALVYLIESIDFVKLKMNIRFYIKKIFAVIK